MMHLKPLNIAIKFGVGAVVVGLLAFALSWNLWDFWGGHDCARADYAELAQLAAHIRSYA